MARLFSAFLFILVVFKPQIITGNMAPFCSSNTDSYNGPKLPSFPDAFEASVEVNIVDRNYTALYQEYYDKNANKGALRKIKNGKSTYNIYNYNENEVMVIDEGNQTCDLQTITGSHFHSFFGRNGSRIEGMADLFRFGASYNETFIGNETVRGISCLHWQTCINHHNHSYLLDYYFSDPDWTMAHGSGEMQVVRATINGTTTRPYHSNGSLPGNSTRSFYHVYDFFSFKPGPPASSAFELPRGVFCTGMRDRKPLPEMKSVFSVEVEILNMDKKSVHYMKEYYDIDRNLAAFKYYDHRHRGYGETLIIHDFTHGVVYNISGSVCQNVAILSLNNTWEAKETADHHIRMKTSAEMVFSNNKSAMIYTGSTTVRGIDADVWIVKEVWGRVGYKHEITSEYYFSKKPWNVKAGSLSNQSQVLLRIDTFNPVTHRKRRMNIINFDAEPVSLSAFNINPCFVNNRAVISIKVKGDDIMGEVSKYETQFNVGVRSSVAKAANVSNLRVDNVWNGKSSEFIQIWLTLLGIPPITSPDVKIVEKNLTEAIEALRMTVEKGHLEIQWDIPGKGRPSTIKAEKFFYDSMDVDKPTSSPVSPTDDRRGKKGKKKGGVPGGAVAGIALLMIAIGICVGLGIAHIIMKRRGTSLFQYQRQE